MLKGQVSLEYMLILSIGLLLFVFSIVALTKGISLVKPMVSSAELASFDDALFMGADSMTPGAQRVVQVDIPAGTGFSRVNYSAGWSTYMVAAGGLNITRMVPYNVTLVPVNLTAYAGTQTLRIYSAHEGEVIVERLS